MLLLHQWAHWAASCHCKPLGPTALSIMIITLRAERIPCGPKGRPRQPGSLLTPTSTLACQTSNDHEQTHGDICLTQSTLRPIAAVMATPTWLTSNGLCFMAEFNPFHSIICYSQFISPRFCGESEWKKWVKCTCCKFLMLQQYDSASVCQLFCKCCWLCALIMEGQPPVKMSTKFSLKFQWYLVNICKMQIKLSVKF